jgi:hypothetical protein
MAAIECSVVFSPSNSDLNKTSVRYFNNILQKTVGKFRFLFSVGRSTTEYLMYPVLAIPGKQPYYGLDNIKTVIESVLSKKRSNNRNVDEQVQDFQKEALGGLKLTPDGKFDLPNDDIDDDDATVVNNDKRRDQMQRETERRKIPSVKPSGSRQQPQPQQSRQQNKQEPRGNGNIVHNVDGVVVDRNLSKQDNLKTINSAFDNLDASNHDEKKDDDMMKNFYANLGADLDD